jgi:hypothetical protein
VSRTVHIIDLPPFPSLLQKAKKLSVSPLSFQSTRLTSLGLVSNKDKSLSSNHLGYHAYFLKLKKLSQKALGKINFCLTSKEDTT